MSLSGMSKDDLGLLKQILKRTSIAPTYSYTIGCPLGSMAVTSVFYITYLHVADICLHSEDKLHVHPDFA